MKTRIERKHCKNVGAVESISLFKLEFGAYLGSMSFGTEEKNIFAEMLELCQ